MDYLEELRERERAWSDAFFGRLYGDIQINLCSDADIVRQKPDAAGQALTKLDIADHCPN